MTFSLIIPSFNKTDRLRMMFWRLANCQTPKDDFEVILIDGNSQDGIEKLVEDYKDKLNIIYFNTLVGKWENPARARNIGYRAASGKYSIMLDGDYLPGEDMMEQFRKSLHDDYFDICYGYAIDSSKGIGHNIGVFNKKVNLYKDKEPIEIYKLPVRTMSRTLMIPLNGPMPEWLFCVKTQTILRIRGYDEEYTGWGREDSDIFKRLSYECPKRVYNPEAICIHIFHESAGPNGARDVTHNDNLFKEKCKGLPVNVVRNIVAPWGALNGAKIMYAYGKFRTFTFPCTLPSGEECLCGGAIKVFAQEYEKPAGTE